MRKTTKELILEELKKEEALTVNNFIDKFQITHMAIRKHLKALEIDGMIVVEERRNDLGRPSKYFVLTDKGDRFFPKKYETISLGFLSDISELYGEGAVETLFERRKQRQAQDYKDAFTNEGEIEKLYELATFQDQKGYMTEVVELDEHTYELREYNCPILDIAKGHHVACKCETEMFKEVLETEAVNRIACRTNEDHYCSFRINFPVAKHN